MFGVQRIGRYEVLSHLASGGMGQVYLARATGLGGFERQVVVKTLDLSITDDDEAFVTMFLDEARLVGALHHQYIAPVYEVGCDEEGRYFLVMDFVQGETAEAVFRVSGERALPVPLAFSLTVASCIASALDYAHGLCAADGTPLDIVHRDVSLSNVMCGHDGAVKLIDFGIAKAANRATKTQVGTLKGKIGYLAPEQILRGPVDHRADIFALGIVMYELTTGTRAFRDASDLVTLERITSGEIRPPSEIVTGYPAELERIVMKALQTEPGQRYQDAGTLGRALEAFAASQQILLGHAAIARVMRTLFDDRRGRRRLARGSSEVNTDSGIAVHAPGDDSTPSSEALGGDALDSNTLAETIDNETITRHVAVARSQRPTTPMVGKAGERMARGNREQPVRPAARQTPPEDLPTPIAAPPRPLAQPFTPLPVELEDAATVIDRNTPSELRPAQSTVQRVPPPPPPVWRERPAADAIRPRRPDAAIRTWVMLCGLFVLALAVAVVVAML